MPTDAETPMSEPTDEQIERGEHVARDRLGRAIAFLDGNLAPFDPDDDQYVVAEFLAHECVGAILRATRDE